MSLNKELTLITKNEQPNDGFYQYVFSSSDSDDAKLQMRVIVSGKKPAQNQSLEDFQLEALSNMSAMFIDSYHLYEYLNTAQNKIVLSGKPNQIKLGDMTYAGVTMYFGNTEATFLVASDKKMTYAFTLISRDSNKQIRQSNLQALTNQLRSIKFNSV